MSQPLMPFKEALSYFEQWLPTLVETETTPAYAALGRVLAENIQSSIDVPPANNSAMDGYALCAIADGSSEIVKHSHYPISQRVPAGQPPEALQQGTCARIFTGAEIPEGANSVIMQEETILNEDGTVTFTKDPQAGENIRPKGQDIAKGKTVLKKGQRLSAMHIGLLASIGVVNVLTYRPLRVGILTTGDELTQPGIPLKPGQIYNSNGPMLSALLMQAGHTVSQLAHCLDNKIDTEKALKSLSDTSDVILSSGGVSVGEEDYVKAAIEINGSIELWKVAMKPGKPIVVAEVFGTPLIGLPGNPSSTLVTFHWLASAALKSASGEFNTTPKPSPLKAGFERKKAIKRDEFLRVSIKSGEALLHPQQSSGALLPACESDGYLHIPAGTSIIQGNLYDFYPFSTF